MQNQIKATKKQKTQCKEQKTKKKKKKHVGVPQEPKTNKKTKGILAGGCSPAPNILFVSLFLFGSFGTPTSFVGVGYIVFLGLWLLFMWFCIVLFGFWLDYFKVMQPQTKKENAKPK